MWKLLGAPDRGISKTYSYLEHCTIRIARIPKSIINSWGTSSESFAMWQSRVFYKDISLSLDSSSYHGSPLHGVFFSVAFAYQQRQKQYEKRIDVILMPCSRL